MGLTSTAVCASFLLATLLLSATLDCAQTQSISKQDMCITLHSLANSLGSSCSINSDCTCVSCNAKIPVIGTSPITICIVDPCTTPVCFKITARPLFSRTVCSTTTIKFTFQKKLLWGTITVPASVTVELVSRPPSKIQMIITATIEPKTYEIASATVCIYCLPGLEDMCASVRSLTNVFNTSDTVTGMCTISDTCLNVDCDLAIKLGNLTLPGSLSVTHLPCQSPFAISVKANITFSGQTISILDGTFTRNATIPVTIFFISGTVNVAIVQVDHGILLSVSGDFGPSLKLTLIENANLIMYCSTPPSPTPLPTPLFSTIPVNKGLEEMCASVGNLTSALSTGATVSGTCNTSDTCLNVNCNLRVALKGSALPVDLLITLLPCQSPFAIYVRAETTLFGQTISIIDGTFSRTETLKVKLFALSGTLTVTIIQQDSGILLSVSGEFPFFGKFTLIENASIIMYCCSA